MYKMKVLIFFFLNRGRSTELPHFLIWFNTWEGMVLKYHTNHTMLSANQENSTLDTCIPNIQNSQNTFRYDISEFFNNYVFPNVGELGG